MERKMSTGNQTTEEKYRIAYRLVFETDDVPDGDVDSDFFSNNEEYGFPEYRMKDEDLPLIDACPFYEDDDV